MPSMLDLDLDTQNICCPTVLKILNEQREGLTLTYRQMIRSKIWDEYCSLCHVSNLNEAYDRLEETITLPFDILNKLNYKYKCSELCPLPDCLENLASWEMELITNYAKIVDIISWLEIGLTMTKTSAWFQIPVDDCRRWNSKRKKISGKMDTYKGFIPYVKYIENAVK